MATAMPIFSIAVDRDCYFDNDSIEVTTTITVSEATVLNPLYIAMVGRLVRWGSKKEILDSHVVYRYDKRPVEFDDDYYMATPGTTIIKAQFITSDSIPACFTKGSWELYYGMWLMQKGEKVDNRVAEVRFDKRSLFFPTAGCKPKAQVDQLPLCVMDLLYSPLKAEVSLINDVFHQGDKIGVQVILFKEDGRLADMVMSVRTTVMQVVKVETKVPGPHPRATILNSEYAIVRNKEDPSHWASVILEDGGMVKHHTMLCDLSKAKYTRHYAIHKFKEANGNEVNEMASSVLYNSNRLDNEKVDATVEVSYHVEVSIHLSGARDINFKLPFSLENTEVTPPPIIMDDPAGDALIRVIPPAIDPPSYENIEKLSEPTYTNLRLYSEESGYWSENTTTSFSTDKSCCVNVSPKRYELPSFGDWFLVKLILGAFLR